MTTTPPAGTTLPAIGADRARYEARDKVTGRVRYPADVRVDRPLWAFAVTGTAARGRITRFDDRAAKAMPGVVAIYSHLNPPAIAPLMFMFDGGRGVSSLQPMTSTELREDGQMIAMVVAETYEAARAAAFAVDFDEASEHPTATMDDPGAETVPFASVNRRHHDVAVGDAEAALAAAPVMVAGDYSMAPQHHNPMELFCTTAVWSGDELTVHEPSQFIYALRADMARQLSIPVEKVRIVSPYLGGGFGSKGPTTSRTAIIAWIARELRRPVKLVLTRAQGFTLTSFRGETRHKVRLGATRDGKMTAYSHEAFELASRRDNFAVAGAKNSAQLYGIPNISTKVHIVRTDRGTPGYMRSPPDMPYMYALESAVDELACALAMDPIELRRINDTMHSPLTGAPYSSRSLMRCYDEAAAAFGWAKRDPRPGSMRDGDWLIGWGCASAILATNMMPATARVRVSRDGRVLVQTAATDMGTGTYTIIAQTAAGLLGVPTEQVTVQLGDSILPPGPAAGGSRTTASVCSAIKLACDTIVARFGGTFPADAALGSAFDRLGASTIEEYAEFSPPSVGAKGIGTLYAGTMFGATGGSDGPVLMQAFGAELIEVRVNRLTREIRVPRMVGAFAAGRILSERTARGQYLGGMVWGVSSALHEATEVDRRSARYTNKDFAEYLVPVNADIPHAEIILVPEHDDQVNPMGVKGIGELSNVGTAAAVASAVYHATGKRVRDLPLTLEKILDA